MKQVPAWHCWPSEHALHAAPEVPHARVLAPPTHAPSAVQQPWQVEKSHVAAVGPQADRTRATGSAKRRRTFTRAAYTGAVKLS